MSKLEKPQGLDAEASRIWDEYFTEMGTIQSLYIRIAMLSDTKAFEYLNLWCCLCSQHAGAYLEAQEGTVQ